MYSYFIQNLCPDCTGCVQYVNSAFQSLILQVRLKLGKLWLHNSEKNSISHSVIIRNHHSKPVCVITNSLITLSGIMHPTFDYKYFK